MSLQFGVSYQGGDYEYVRVRRWPFSIGRNPANDLCLANSSHISRRHARIFKETDGYRLFALGSNPTFLNGDPVVPDEPVLIQPGDRIELPDYLLEVRDTRELPTWHRRRRPTQIPSGPTPPGSTCSVRPPSSRDTAG